MIFVVHPFCQIKNIVMLKYCEYVYIFVIFEQDLVLYD